MSKKVPIRKCVACGERKPKNELIRVVYNKGEGVISIDRKGKMPGRGAYLCPEKKCFDLANKAKKIERSLKISISDEIYQNLIKEIDIMKG
ncbi:RNase P modulator RnpM [Natronospora cellulosivora (SeqCode)]